jgi:two-component system OmpR family sensor kinase
VRRLFWKILLGFWLTLLTVALLVGAFSYFYFVVRLHGPGELAEGRRVAPLVSTVANSLQAGGRAGLATLEKNWPRFILNQLMVVDEQGHDLLGHPLSETVLEEAKNQLARNEPPDEQGVREVITPDGQRYLVFVLANVARHGPPHLLHGPPLQLLIGITLAGLLFSAALAWYLTRPLKTLSQAFANVAAGKLDTRVGPQMGKRRDEIADLGADFDRMAEQLKSLVSAQRQLLHDVSHELRSPLGRLQLAVGLARQQPERIATSLDRIELEASRLDSLVGEILTISRLEANGEQHWDEYFDLYELVDSVVADARFEADNAGVALSLEQQDGSAEALMRGRAELMHSALENILRNALKFSKSGDTVTLRMSRKAEPDEMVIRIMDQGPGVPAEQLNTIFEPFVRLSEGRSGSGYGLGLAIARRAVIAHHGSIGASNLAQGGLCVTITLPLHAL